MNSSTKMIQLIAREHGLDSSSPFFKLDIQALSYSCVEVGDEGTEALFSQVDLDEVEWAQVVSI